VYFWKLQSLKQDLIGARLSQRQSCLYLLCLGGLTMLGYSIPADPLGLWDHVVSAIAITGFLLGTMYLYRCNGGAAGADFLSRYVSMNWVFGIRFLILLALPAMFATVGVELLLTDDVPDHTTPVEASVSAVLALCYFWRLGHHFSHVAERGAA